MKKAKGGATTAGYSGTPLARKLGIKPGATVMLIKAPRGFERDLEPLPDDVRFKATARGTADLVVWFVIAARDLQQRVADLGAKSPGLWICWPKKASGVATDVTQDLVRGAGLDAGLVDYKICAIDETWSGLKFAPRKN